MKDFLNKNKTMIITTILSFVITTIALIGATGQDVKVMASFGNETSQLQYIHRMTNSVITSEQIWGKEKINYKNIQTALEYAKNLRNATITAYLEDWKQGDFSNSVEFHNYVWELLGGTVGIADGLNEEAISKINIYE